MKRQGSNRLRRTPTGAIVLFFTIGCGMGLIAVIEDMPSPSLWRIADLFFDFALLSMMVSRGLSLLKG